MSGGDSHQANYHLVETALNSIADWVNRFRKASGDARDLGACRSEDVMEIANDLGVPASELYQLARKGPQSLTLLRRMLGALGVDAKALSKMDPLVTRDLQRVCTNCLDQRKCSHELAKGTAAAHFHDFCPNAVTLDSLIEEKPQTAKA